MKHVHVYSLAALAVMAASAPLAQAQEDRVYLTKAELEATLVGKQHTFKAASGNTLKWDLRQGGTLYYNNANFANSGGNGSGTWEIRDDGALCVKWNRVESGPGGCNYYFKQGEKYLRSGGNKPDSRINAELLSIG